MTEFMKAVVIHAPGGPEALVLERRPRPESRPGAALIRVRAFGLNRSEVFTRRGMSPNVVFPRILGIEAVGEIVDAPDGGFAPGDRVATAMGGMGRDFDGGYAEFVSAPASQVRRLETTLDWPTLGALPEMLQTAWGSLFKALRLEPGQSLLIRGGTTSVGLAAAALAKRHGATVAATSRRRDRAAMLRANGADLVFVDDGRIDASVLDVFPDGVDRVLELVGATTLRDSLQCAAEGGVVCMTGMVGDAWSLADFSPMDAIPTGVRLTTYSGGVEEFMATPLQDLVRLVETGHLRPPLGPVFPIERISEAHALMEAGGAGGKIVVVP